MSDVERRPVEIFIDVPNTMRQATKPDIDWDVLCKEIGSRLKPGEFVHRAAAYVLTDHPSGRHGATSRDLVQGTFRIDDCALHLHHATREKDVDVHIMNDIWRSLLHFSVRGYTQVRHILVSGDGDYMTAYQGAAHELRGEMHIELDVYAWSHKTGKDLEKYPHRTWHLDRVPNLIDLTNVRFFAAG